MATSGTLGKLTGNWKTTYTITWSLLSQSVADNTSSIRLTATLYTGNSTTISTTNSKYTLDGTTVYNSSYSKSGAGNIFVKTKDITVEHNTDGSFPTRKVNFSAWDYGAFETEQSGSGTISADDIPNIERYATVTQSLSSKTQTTITMKWSSDSTIDYIWYSKDNGSNWTGINVTDGKSGTYTISNLNSGTTYKIKTKVRRKDSQLSTTSESLTATTEDYVVKVKINSSWKNAVPYIKVSGTWKKAIPYIKVNGTWEPGID